MKKACFYLFLLLNLLHSTGIAAQAVQRIPTKLTSVRMQAEFGQVPINTAASDSLRKRPFRFGPPADWALNHREPLYVINGKIVSGEKLKRVVPHEIENVDVIKGNRAIALYGLQGADGVIVITTKKHRFIK